MKSQAQPVIWSHRTWSKDGISAPERREAGNVAVAVDAECEPEFCRPAASSSLSTPLRIVGILAFCQALVFVVLFLFICARAGAATQASPASSLELSTSVYAPQNARDPFGSEVPKSTNGSVTTPAPRLVDTDTLKLQGILYNKASPSALINDQLLELNKPTKVHTTQGEVEVKALEITREQVTLDIGGQKVELRLGSSEPRPATK